MNEKIEDFKNKRPDEYQEYLSYLNAKKKLERLRLFTILLLIILACGSVFYLTIFWAILCLAFLILLGILLVQRMNRTLRTLHLSISLITLTFEGEDAISAEDMATLKDLFKED